MDPTVSGIKLTLHASCVAIGNVAVLIQGPSGSGKSTLALELMVRGGVLVSDDQTELNAIEGVVVAKCPAEIRGKIEARGIGILAAQTVEAAAVKLIIDLGNIEKDRLPIFRKENVCGIDIPLLYNTGHVQFPAAIVQYLKGGRIE